MLEKHGIQAPVSRTIDVNVDMLIAVEYDIVRTHVNGRPSFCKIVERDFDTVELKVLIDAVAASRFISIEKSKRIISHLASLDARSDYPYLESELAHVQSIKKAIGGTLYTADVIFRAIVAKKKIQFQMTEYRAPDKTVVSHREGKLYVVSPYATI